MLIACVCSLRHLSESEEGEMNKDQVTGKDEEIIGNIEQQAGYWTDDKAFEANGIILQAEVLAQKAWGDLKEVLDHADERINSMKDANTTRNKKKSHEPA